MALSNQMIQAQASPDCDKAIFSGLLVESLDAIAGPLAICAAGLVWFLAFDLTVPLPGPVAVVVPSASTSASVSAPALTRVLALKSENAMSASITEPALLYTVSQSPAPFPVLRP